MANVIDEARLICVNIAKGNNKLYWMDLYDNGDVRVRYGRYHENSKGELEFAKDETHKGAGQSWFEAKKREKLRPKASGKESYVEQAIAKNVDAPKVIQSTSLKSLALSQIRTNHDEAKRIIEWWCDANIHNITSNTKINYNETTGLFTTPFGLVTADGINQARQYLSRIKSCMESQSTGADFEDAINAYLRIIPRDIGRQKASYTNVFNSVDSVLKANDVLDSLESSLVAATTPKKDDNDKQEVEQLFDCSLELVTDTNEFDEIVALYTNTSRDMHAFASGWRIVKVYRLDHVPMREAYERDGKILGEDKKLWHGTGFGNIVSILRKPGFQITPPATAHIAGKAFGYGIYLAIHSTKAFGYASSFWGGRSGEKAFMFLNDVSLGKWYVPRQSTSSPPPQGYHTYWAKPTETRKFGGYLENDEIVIFNSHQMNPVYLVQLEK